MKFRNYFYKLVVAIGLMLTIAACAGSCSQSNVLSVIYSGIDRQSVTEKTAKKAWDSKGGFSAFQQHIRSSLTDI
jgi:hypothetical protein